MYNLA